MCRMLALALKINFAGKHNSVHVSISLLKTKPRPWLLPKLLKNLRNQEVLTQKAWFLIKLKGCIVPDWDA